jgi:hypothetical protein
VYYLGRGFFILFVNEVFISFIPLYFFSFSVNCEVRQQYQLLLKPHALLFSATHVEPEKAELEVLKSAAAKLDALLEEKGISEDELVEEFRQLRQQK